MRFMLMAKSNENVPGNPPPTQELMAGIGKLVDEMKQTGVLVDTGGLMPTSTGARLHLSGGKVTVTDGPFTEAKELIGGFAIIDVKSKAEAVNWATRFMQIHADVLGPSYQTESEVRQMYGPDDPGPDLKK